MKPKTLKFFLPLCPPRLPRGPLCGGSDLEAGCSYVEYVDRNGIEREGPTDATVARVLF